MKVDVNEFIENKDRYIDEKELKVFGKAPSDCNSLFSDLRCEVLDVSELDVSEISVVRGMFYNCNNLIAIKGLDQWNLSDISELDDMFCNCYNLEKVDLSSWKFSDEQADGISIDNTFLNCYNLKEIKGTENWGVISPYHALTFKNCYNLKSIDLSNAKNEEEMLESENVLDFYKTMFVNCRSLEEVNLHPMVDEPNMLCELIEPETSVFNINNKLQKMNGKMLKEIKRSLYVVDINDIENRSYLRNAKAIKVVGKAPKNCAKLLMDMNNEIIDVSDLDTSEMQNAAYMFSGNKCREIRGLEKLELNNLINANCMFYNCGSLQKIDAPNLNVKNLNSFNSAFNNCVSLKSVNLSNWKTNNLNSIEYLFRDCRDLNSVNLRGWNIDNLFNTKSLFSLIIENNCPCCIHLYIDDEVIKDAIKKGMINSKRILTINGEMASEVVERINKEIREEAEQETDDFDLW